MATAIQVFTPCALDASTVSLSATTTTDAVTLPTAVSGPGGSVRVYNAGPQTVFLRFGGTSVVALVTDMPVPPGTIEILGVLPGQAKVACITSTSTATVYFTAGQGA